MKVHVKEFPIEKMAKIMGVSRSGYYAYLHYFPSARKQENASIVLAIKEAYKESRKLYGSPRIHALLQRQGMACSRKRVAKLMKAEGIRAIMNMKGHRRKKMVGEASPNLLKQDFSASAPNKKWSSDISYIKTGEGWLYLAVIIDLFSRKVVSFTIESHMRAELVENTLQKAFFRRAPSLGLVHHSDRGSQYTSSSFRELCLDSGVTQSMNSGSCYDNAATESFFHSLKTELVYLDNFKTKREAKRAIFEYIESFYNRKRLHSTLGYQSPEEFEQNHWEKQWREKICV